MKTAVVSYSWSGHARAKAKALAEREQAALYEIKDKRKPGALAAIGAERASATHI